jgi:hypothetical protein
MPRGKDLAPRKRRKKTDAEKEVTRLAKEEKKRRRQQHDDEMKRKADHKRKMNFFRPFDCGDTNIDNGIPGNRDDSTDDVIMETTDIIDTDDDGIITFSEEIDAGCADEDPSIVANLDIDEDAADDLDEGAEAEPDNQAPSKLKCGVQATFMIHIQERLKKEIANKTKALERKWLLDHLKMNDGWIRKEQAESMIRSLTSSRQSPSTCNDATIKWAKYNRPYYKDIKVWLPDLLLLGGCTPCCPSCKSDSHVVRHGFNTNHIGREVIGLTENYYILTCRYKCKSCEQKKRELLQAAIAEESPVPVKLKYTFMGWDAESLPLTALGAGDEFPAILTWRAGIDKELLDLMRPLFDKGVRPEAFSDTILELHAKEHTRAWLRYEREFMLEKRKNALDKDWAAWPEFSSMYDPDLWNDHTPTGTYLAKAYKRSNQEMRLHLDKEVKKRGAKSLHPDTSYKEGKNLCQWRGKSIFNGLETVLTEVGEVRIQHHVVSDSHDQKTTPLEAFKKTTQEYGLPQPQLIFTDNPSRDYNFYFNMFESIQQQKAKFNAGLSDLAAPNESSYPFDPETPHLKIISTAEEINLAIASMMEIMDTQKGFALDSEHKVTFNGRGMGKEESKIGLIQIAFFNKSENDRIQYIFIRTHKLKKLPIPLVRLLSGPVPVIGVNVGGDLARIAHDFDIGHAMGNRPKNTIINLGTYARKRDVIQNGAIGMKQLIKTVLGLTVDKNKDDTFSDWNAKELSASQIKYALIDVDGPLKVFLELSKKPDLTQRLKLSEASIGKLVDVVPRYGSVACMATRAASGRIIDAVYCESPEGIVQSKVRAGAGMVAVQLDTIYSPSLQIPHYRKIDKNAKPTLADFGNGMLILPIQMLKEHIESDEIREYGGSVANQSGLTVPATSISQRGDEGLSSQNVSVDESNEECDHDLPHQNNTVDGSRLNGDDDIDEYSQEYTDDYLTGNALDDIGIDLTLDDIELLRASAVEGEFVSGDRIPLHCEWLPDAPSPNEICDVYSPQLGDVFHAMNRPYVPINHEAKKGYFVALQNAFFVYNEEQMKHLVDRMKDSGVTDGEIERMKYFNSQIFISCVERQVPPPSILYWRVRAVFALYGSMIDGKTNKPLFTAKAWAKAKGILTEILLGYYSDPPGMCMYTKRMRRNGTVHKNKYGIEMIECIRGTNRTEAYHKNLIVTFRHWHTGIEMSDCLLSERRHRHNHRCSERRRFGFPTLGHFDTWLVDQLQILVLANRGRVLYPNWSNSSDYRDTDESFDTVAIHSLELDEALKYEWENRINKQAVKLTSDQSYMCRRMGVPLPFLPFSTQEENQLFANCALADDFPMQNADEAAIAWCKYVDGVTIFPKLPVHIRTHKEAFERNMRVKDCVERARSGKERLDELNNAVKPTVAANSEAVTCPDALPPIHPNATHNEPHVITAGTAIGLPVYPSDKRRRGSRGHDKKQRAPRSCGRCKLYNGEHMHECVGRGRGGNDACQYFDFDGTPR